MLHQLKAQQFLTTPNIKAQQFYTSFLGLISPLSQYSISEVEFLLLNQYFSIHLGLENC